MFELTWQAQLINVVTAFVLGFGWTIGCRLAEKFWNALFRPAKQP